ncbi:hypothetical protein JCM8115_002000 [Rhodotorula mucilaginosa]
MGVTVRIGQYGKPWQHAEPYPAFYLKSPPGVNPDPRIWFNVPKHMLLTVGNDGHHLVRPRDRLSGTRSVEHELQRLGTSAYAEAGPYIVARSRKFREDLIVAYSDPQTRAVSMRSTWIPQQKLPVETHAELLLAVHEHCAGVAYSLTNAFQVLLVDHLCVVKALRRLQEPSDNGEDASIQHELRRDHLSKAAVSADARIPTAHVPFAPLNPNALAPVRKRSLSSGTDAVSAHAEPTMATAPKRQRLITSLGHSPSTADVAGGADSASRHSSSESPASAQEQSGIDLPDLPARPFVKPGSTTPADTSLNIEDRALEEGVAAAMIAQGSAELDSTICEYLNDEGSHEAVGMEGGGVLDAIDKPLVPVLIEMIR